MGYILGLTDLIIPEKGAIGMWIGLCLGVLLASVLVFFRLDKTSRRAIEESDFKVV